MSISQIKGDVVDVHLWTPVTEVESSALTQLRNIAGLPWVFHHVAVMPDVHYGKGATVGSVVAMKEAVAPAAVGVDIGCGMAALKTSLKASDLPDNLEAIRHALERSVPVGFNSHDHVASAVAHLKLWGTWDALQHGIRCVKEKAMKQIGTLGGGNHFIELCLDTEQNVWLMLHSGSRNVGKEIAERHINIAKKLAHNGHLPDPDLAVFLAGTPEMQAYRHDLFWAQEYAWQNRLQMLELCKRDLERAFPQISFDAPIVCHHNYVSEETHFEAEVLVTRKGAINAGKGVLGIIPGSMGSKSYIVRGLGNPESFHSASHGAGRRMSRGAAKRAYTVDDLKTQTEGVCCRKDAGVLDEIPGAYKDIDVVMANQSDLVEIVTELKGVLCIKG